MPGGHQLRLDVDRCWKGRNMPKMPLSAGIGARETRDKVLALNPAFAARIWRPGQSGNPGGKGGRFQEVQRICREASPDAARKLVALIDDEDARIAGWACDKVLERAYGKPKEYDPRAEEPETPAIDPAQFTPKQREQIKRVLMMLLGAQPAETGEPR
jgi:hypothetical protein